MLPPSHLAAVDVHRHQGSTIGLLVPVHQQHAMLENGEVPAYVVEGDGTGIPQRSAGLHVQHGDAVSGPDDSVWGERDDVERSGAQVLDILARPDRLTRRRVESDHAVGHAHHHRAERRKPHEGDILPRGELPKHRVRGQRRGALGSQRRTDRQGQQGKKCVPPEHESPPRPRAHHCLRANVRYAEGPRRGASREVRDIPRVLV